MKKFKICLILLIVLIACLPATLMGNFYTFISILNIFILSPLAIPLLFILPKLLGNNIFYILYVLFLPLGYNILLSIVTLKESDYIVIPIIFLFIGFAIMEYLKNSKNSLYEEK